MLILFLFILGFILVYKYKGKLTPAERAQKNREKQKYSLEKIQTFNKNVLSTLNTSKYAIEIFEENKSGVDGILLYGTNAVGKTSFIRSLGISLIMAQSGLFVPCSEFIYMPYTYIFTRILGNDNIFKGLSTFAVEMSELRTILRLADKNSLVLGDELCAGTESISAQALVASGIQWLSTRNAKFIFATHLHELVHLESIKSLDNVKAFHLSVDYDSKEDVLIYDRTLKEGSGDKIYGILVAKYIIDNKQFIEDTIDMVLDIMEK